MRCLLCHNAYKQPGGEDRVFADERWLLESHGHEVVTLTAHNDTIDAMPRIQTACRTVWSRWAYDQVRRLICRHRPDVVHCTNIFPLISPAVYYAAHAAGVPVVQSLHNYRMHCSNGFLFRGGRPCTACVGKLAAWRGVLHGCYRGSRAASAVVATMQAAHAVGGAWTTAVDQYIACSEYARRTFIRGGMSPDLVAVKPNFVRPDPGVGTGKEGYAIFVGRLSPEKGVDTLLRAWTRMPADARLTIVGEGPLAPVVQAAVSRDPRIDWTGWCEPARVASLIGTARCLVMPSLWPEIFGRTVVEAFASGTPVVASRLGALEELVQDGVTGRLVPPGDPAALAAAISTKLTEPTDAHHRHRAAARAEYEHNYTPGRNLDRLLALYERAQDHYQTRAVRRRCAVSRPATPVAGGSGPPHRAPRLTIGVPVYNAERYLAAALDSLLHQTFDDFEIVISDNASTDGTAALCRRYAERDTRIRYMRQPANVGANQNFNLVFAHARGRYFKWASHDDLCAPTFLERCIETLETNPDLVWCHTRSTHIDSAGDALSAPGMADVTYTRDPARSRAAADPARRFAAVLLGDGGCLDSYGVIRTSVMRQTGLIRPFFGAEKVFIAELALRGRFAETPEVLFFPRVHPAAAGSLPTAAEQARYTTCSPRPTGLVHRVGLLLGYVDAVRRARLRPFESAQCLVVLARYLIQPHKWRTVLTAAISGCSMGDEIRQQMRRPASQPDQHPRASVKSARRAAADPQGLRG